MKCVFNSNHATTVIRQMDQLWSQSSYISTVMEAVAKIRVDAATFAINDARWGIYRSSDGVLDQLAEVRELIGVEAFIDVGSSLRAAVGEKGGGLPRELLAECVRGLIQAETFVYKERGYASAKEYDEYWEEYDRDYCRYFSDADKVEKPWREYIGNSERGDDLYNRVKSTQVWVCRDGGLLIYGSFVDSFHELSIQIQTSPAGIVQECQGNYLRAPGQACFDNQQNLPSLLGMDLFSMSKKDVAAKLGGAQGCYHLVDIVFDASYAVEHVIRDTQGRS